MVFHDRPVLVSWTITKQCNLHCSHCYLTERNDEPDDLDNITNSLIEAKILAVTLTGGEPLMRADICNIIEKLASHNISVHLNTNGLLITPELAARLRSAGIESVRISLDGADETTHEKIRQATGSFRAAQNAISILVSQGITTSIATVPTIFNVHQLEEIVVLGHKLGAQSHYFFRFVPTRGSEHNYLLLPAHKYIASMINLSKSYSINWEEPLRATFSPISSFGCSAGTTYVSLDNAGNVYPCPSLPIVIGNISEKSLIDIWNTRMLTRFRQRDFKPCLDCKYQQNCGGCRAAAWANCGDPYGPDPYCLQLGGGYR